MQSSEIDLIYIEKTRGFEENSQLIGVLTSLLKQQKWILKQRSGIPFFKDYVTRNELQ